MRALAFWKTVTVDESDLLGRFIGLLEKEGIRYCVVVGQAVNAYVDPVVSLDLDLVVAVDQMDKVMTMLCPPYQVTRFERSLSVSLPGSDLRIQILTDERYFGFVDRASKGKILGMDLPVAHIEDVLRGKIWAVQDPSRRASKRQKDLADISRLTEAHPDLRGQVPDEILGRLI